MNFLRKIWLISSAGILILAVGILTVNVFDFGAISATQATNSNITASLTAGSLAVSAPGTAALADVSLDSIPDTNGQATGLLSNIEVRDHRQSAPGWSVTVTCSDFTDGVSTISVTNFSVEPQSISPVGNSSISGVNPGSTHKFTGISDPTTIMSANSGAGRGRFFLDTNLALEIGVATKPSGYTATLTETIS